MGADLVAVQDASTDAVIGCSRNVANPRACFPSMRPHDPETCADGLLPEEHADRSVGEGGGWR